MIFPDLRLILIHQPRTGLSSVEAQLVQYCTGERPHDTSAWERETGQGTWNKHFDALRVEAFWSEAWNDPAWTVATSVRDPFELIVSQYLQNTEGATVEGFRRWILSLGDREPILLTAAEVDEWQPALARLAGGATPESAGLSQSRFLAHRASRELWWLRFSHLAEDVTALARHLGLSDFRLWERRGIRNPGSPGFRGLPHRGGRLQYDAFWNPETRAAAKHQIARDEELMSLQGPLICPWLRIDFASDESAPMSHDTG